jgi:NADH-quinone oxidoreductase subunit H
MLVISAVAVTVFSGGWYFPFLGRLQSSSPILFATLSVLVFTAKIMVFIYLYIWFRWTFPRYRYDQLMDLGWKWLIPAAMANIVLTGALIVIGQALNLTRSEGERLIIPGVAGKAYFIGTAFLVAIPVTWILLAMINRRSYDFNLRVQRQIRLEGQRREEVFGQV